MKVYKKRGASLVVNNKCDRFKTLIEEQKVYKAACQDIFNITRNLMLSNKLLKRTFGSFCDLCLVKDTDLYQKLIEFVVEKKELDRKTGKETILYTITSANLVKTLFKDVFKKYNFEEDGIANYKRTIVKHSIDRIDGYLTRNKKKKSIKMGKMPHITFKGRVIHIGEGCNYSKETGILTMPYSKGKLSIPIYAYYGKAMVSKNFGGNIVFKYDQKGNIYTAVIKAAVDIIDDTSYLPSGFIGFDINQEAKFWICFDNGTTITRPQEMTDLIKENKILNKEISNDDKQSKVVLQDGTILEHGLNSKQRRKYRIKQKHVYDSIKKMTKIFANAIVDRAIEEGKGIAIDKINPGASNAEFGQYISNYIIGICEDKKIPFYVCPSAYSSRRCICGNVDKQNRNKKTNEFKCISCGYYTPNSHIHAAENMRRAAEELYRNNCMFSSSQASTIERTIEKIQQLEEKISKKLLTKEKSMV